MSTICYIIVNPENSFYLMILNVSIFQWRVEYYNRYYPEYQ